MNADQRLATVNAVAVACEPRFRRHEVKDAVLRDRPHEFGGRSRTAFVKEHPGDALEIKGGGVAKENRLHDHGHHENLSGPRVFEHRDEFLQDERPNAVEKSEKRLHDPVLRPVGESEPPTPP